MLIRALQRSAFISGGDVQARACSAPLCHKFEGGFAEGGNVCMAV